MSDRSLDRLDGPTRRRIDDMAAIAKLATRLSTVMPDRVATINAAKQGQPGAKRPDQNGTNGHTSIKFCEIHESDRCGPDGRTTCGEGTTYAGVSDPTGEAAIRAVEHGDLAEADLRTLDRHLRAATNALLGAATLVARYSPRVSTDYDRSKTTNAEPGCQSCARLEIVKGRKRWELVYATTKIEGRPTPLCRWCWDWLRDTARLPTRHELQLHHDNRRVKRPPLTIPAESRGTAAP